MNAIIQTCRRRAVPLVAVSLILGLFWLTQSPTLSTEERAELGARFRFEPWPLPELPGATTKSVRGVHPALKHISSWISSVGAAVTLADLDGDGLPNDLVYVDPRTDSVMVAPVPGTPARYAPFTLDPGPALYDTATMAPMGCVAVDLNEDGLMDLIVYYWGRTPIAFLRKRPESGSAPATLRAADFVPYEIVPGGERWYTNAATVADLDGDGHLDLVIGNYFADGSRILDTGAADPQCMPDSMSRAFNGGGVRLLLWKGGTARAEPTVRFEETHGVLGMEVAHGWTLAVGACDLDGDLLPELYIANDFGPDRLLHNRSTPGQLRFVPVEGRKTLTTPNSCVLGRDSFKGMGVDFGDLNGDGLPDIVVSNITTEYGLLESNFVFLSTGEPHRMREGVAPYLDHSESLGLARSGWGWDVKLGDFDNDGIPEIVQATGFIRGEANRWPELQELAMGNDQLLRFPGNWPRFKPGDDLCGRQHPMFFVRSRSGRYFDLSAEVGLGSPQVTRGIAVADVDGDGRLDFALARQWELSHFYRNVSPNPGAFLGLHLLLPLDPKATLTARMGHPAPDLPGRPAVGAAAKVLLPDGKRLVGQVDGGNGHAGRRSPDLHFGLGQLASDSRLRVDLRWRDGAGHVRQETLFLAPGWNTVLLGDSPKGVEP